MLRAYTWRKLEIHIHFSQKTSRDKLIWKRWKVDKKSSSSVRVELIDQLNATTRAKKLKKN
jgi:hypothetical protein